MTATVVAGRRDGATGGEASGAPAPHRDLSFGARAEPTVLTRPLAGRPARGPVDRRARELGARPDLLPPFLVLSWCASQRRPAALAAGAAELVAPWGGPIAPALRHRDAAAPFDSLVDV